MDVREKEKQACEFLEEGAEARTSNYVRHICYRVTRGMFQPEVS
jgi:hypothetical protein